MDSAVDRGGVWPHPDASALHTRTVMTSHIPSRLHPIPSHFPTVLLTDSPRLARPSCAVLSHPIPSGPRNRKKRAVIAPLGPIACTHGTHTPFVPIPTLPSPRARARTHARTHTCMQVAHSDPLVLASQGVRERPLSRGGTTRIGRGARVPRGRGGSRGWGGCRIGFGLWLIGGGKG